MPVYSAIPDLVEHIVWAYDYHTDHRLRTREKTERAEAGPVAVIVNPGRIYALDSTT